MPELGAIAESVSALIACVALIQSWLSRDASKKTKGELEQLKMQVNTQQLLMQSIQSAQANAQRTNINIAVTTGQGATPTGRLIAPGTEESEGPAEG
jgi:hypothetical protein